MQNKFHFTEFLLNSNNCFTHSEEIHGAFLLVRDAVPAHCSFPLRGQIIALPQGSLALEQVLGQEEGVGHLERFFF